MLQANRRDWAGKFERKSGEQSSALARMDNRDELEQEFNVNKKMGEMGKESEARFGLLAHERVTNIEC